MNLDEAFVDEEMEPDADLNRITNAVIGACIEVHRTLGPGYAESVYEAALAREMMIRGIAFVRQFSFDVVYKGAVVGEGRVDFLVEDKVVVELKAAENLSPVHSAQTYSYLVAINSPLGLLINFNVKKLVDGIRRIAN